MNEQRAFPSIEVTANPRRLTVAALAVLALALTSSSTRAASLSIAPPTPIAVGETIEIEVSVSELATSGPPSLGAIDFRLDYDPTILAWVGSVFADDLGPVGSASQSRLEVPVPGAIDVFQLSLLSPDAASCTDCDPPYLDVDQPASFIVVTLTFEGVAPGTSPLVVLPVSAADAEGAPLPATGDSTSVSVPEPSLTLSALLGACLLVARRRAGLSMSGIGRGRLPQSRQTPPGFICP